MARVTQRGIDAALPYSTPVSWATGGAPAVSTTQGTDTTPAVTEEFVCEVFVPVNTLSTGVSILNGSAVAGNVTAILYDSNGGIVANSASTSQSGTAAFQDLAWSSTAQLRGPAKYYVGLMCNNTGARFRTHALGKFTTTKKTGQTYGTLTTLTVPTTFTANVGVVASLY